jgi:pyruvate dehydrogenase E1 component beta subunit
MRITPDYGERSEAMPVMNMVQAINLALREEMARDGRVVLLGEDVGRDGGVFRVTEGLLDAFGPDRVMDTPLSESAIAGAAIGMAVRGLLPVAEIQFMGFCYAAMDQIVTHASRIRTRSRGRYTAPLVLRTPYGAGIKAPELHEESTEALFCQIPGIRVVVPSGPRTAKGLLLAAIRDPDPVIFLEPTRLYRMIREEVPEGQFTLPLGRAELVRKGDAVTVIAWGSMLERTLRAVDGYDADVIDLLTLSPFDEEAILASVEKTGRVVIIHEAPLTCGLGAELAATIADRAILSLRGPVLRVAAPDVPVPLARLVDHYLPSVERIRSALDDILRY